MAADRTVSTEWAALKQSGLLQLHRAGFQIDLQFEKRGDRVYIVTPVFRGGNYIPESVRRCLQGHGLHALDRYVDIRLTIDEERHQVLLLFQAVVHGSREFEEVLEEFLSIADEWRTMLDEHGQQDLVYIHVSS